MMRVYIYFLIIFLTTSCELIKEIDYNTIYKNDKIVIHGFINAIDGVKIIVKKTVPPNSVCSDDKLNEINIDLYEDNKKVQSLISINDYFYSTPTKFIPKLGSYYYIEAVSGNLPKVLSLPQTIPLPVEIDSLYLVIDKLTSYANLIVSFYNSQQMEVSFYLKIQYFQGGEIDSSRVENEIFNPYGLIEKPNKGLNIIERQVGHISGFDSLKVEFYTLSPDLTKFLKSLKRYESSKEDPFFEQTYPVFTNIENGYGIFASYSYTTRIVNKK